MCSTIQTRDKARLTICSFYHLDQCCQHLFSAPIEEEPIKQVNCQHEALNFIYRQTIYLTMISVKARCNSDYKRFEDVSRKILITSGSRFAAVQIIKV